MPVLQVTVQTTSRLDVVAVVPDSSVVGGTSGRPARPDDLVSGEGTLQIRSAIANHGGSHRAKVQAV